MEVDESRANLAVGVETAKGIPTTVNRTGAVGEQAGLQKGSSGGLLFLTLLWGDWSIG